MSPSVSSIDPRDIWCGSRASGMTPECLVWIRVYSMILGYLAWALGCPAQIPGIQYGLRYLAWAPEYLC